jgi:hypothetical protein
MPTFSMFQNLVTPEIVSPGEKNFAGLLSLDVAELNNWDTAAYPSSGVTLLNIPEPDELSAKFTYNYYVRDERTNGGNSKAIINTASPSQESDFLARTGEFPRFIRLMMSPAKFGVKDGMLEGIFKSLGRNAIWKNQSSIHFEGPISSAMFSSLRLQDNQIDQSFYYALSSSISFFNIDEDTSGRAQADSISSHISASSAFSPNGEAIRDVLSSMQSQGVSYAPTDVRQDISNEALRSVRFVNFTQNINNLIISNFIQGAVEDKTNIYEDELESALDEAAVLQSNAIAASDPNTISSDQYRVPVLSIYQEAVPANVEMQAKYNEASIPIGLYIEKYEISQNPDGETWERIEHDPIIIEKYPDSSANVSIVDKNVKYGASYVYNVRTVVLTRFEALMKDGYADVEDQMIIAVIMAASKGLTVQVNCKEEIPPEPPGNVSFSFDYNSDNLLIFWEEPTNPQRDVMRYQIFRRKSVDVPFTLIREYDFDHSTSKVVPIEGTPKTLITKQKAARKVYKDLEFTMDSKYIYAIACIDARGFTSNYSSQHEVSFDRTKNKLRTKLVSKRNAPKPYPNLYLNEDLFADTMKDSGHKRLRVFFDPEYYDIFEVIDGGKSTNKTSKGSGSQIRAESSARRRLRIKNSLGLIGNNYKIQIINVDRQLSKMINIDIVDQSGDPIEIPLNEATLTSLPNISAASTS